MSSWANRKIPQKRDLSQIPEPFRPVIIPRVARPEVISSEAYQLQESYQKQKENEIIYPVESDWKTSFPGYSTSIAKTFSIKPPNAKELIHNEKSYVFVILRNIQKSSDNDLWLSAYHSIRQFYTNQIIIIDDNSSINTVNGKLQNTEIIQSEYNGAGEILPFYYFQKQKWADTMIFIHDSMVLHRAFTEDELDHEVVFHWHFTETSQDLISKSIGLLSSLTKSKELEDYASRGSWIGCFGGACIIDASVVDMLEEKYKLSKLAAFIRTRKQRQIVERIIGIILSYEKKVASNFGDIMKYPNTFETNNLQASIRAISSTNYNTAIIKMWRGR
jgi:hypothetical protein